MQTKERTEQRADVVSSSERLLKWIKCHERMKTKISNTHVSIELKIIIVSVYRIGHLCNLKG